MVNARVDAAYAGHAAPGAAPLLVLAGPPGAGKSTVGALIGADLGCGLLDTDALVVRAAGTTIPELFARHGEPAFRALEREAVAGALTGHTGVVALGGGAVLHPGTQEDLARHRVIFLDVGVDGAAVRAGFDRGRPLLAGDPRARWSALMEQRREIYERLATWRVDTDGRSPRDVADEILGLLGRGSGRE